MTPEELKKKMAIDLRIAKYPPIEPYTKMRVSWTEADGEFYPYFHDAPIEDLNKMNEALNQ